MHRNTTPQTSCNMFDCVEIHRQRFYFWCCDECMTSGMRVTPTNAERGERRQVYNISDAISVAGEGCPYHKFAPEYRRSTSSVSSITLAVPIAAWRLRRLTRNDLCLWVSALRLESTALPYAAYSMAGRGLFRNAPFLVQKQGKLPAGERCRLRHSSCAA